MIHVIRIHMGVMWDLVWASNTERSDGANENMRRDQVLDQEIDVRFS